MTKDTRTDPDENATATAGERPQAEPADGPVTPRDAASLLVYRGDVASPEILLGRRPKTSRFMPDVFVYPGGAVDRGDANIAAIDTLAPDIDERLKQSATSCAPHTLAVTAIRETYEETGLMLADVGDPGPSDDPTWAAFRELGLAPTLAPLRYIGRATTPPYRPRRFHARFFAVAADRLRGTYSATEELPELAWFNARRTGDLPMADVTRFMLEQLLNMLESEGNWIGRASFTHLDGKRHVAYDD